jgi:hypothetical protein
MATRVSVAAESEKKEGEKGGCFWLSVCFPASIGFSVRSSMHGFFSTAHLSMSILISMCHIAFYTFNI